MFLWTKLLRIHTVLTIQHGKLERLFYFKFCTSHFRYVIDANQGLNGYFIHFQNGNKLLHSDRIDSISVSYYLTSVNVYTILYVHFIKLYFWTLNNYLPILNHRHSKLLLLEHIQNEIKVIYGNVDFKHLFTVKVCLTMVKMKQR